MTSAETRKPPAPVIGAVALYALCAAFPLVLAIAAIVVGKPAAALLALLGVLPGAIAWGLWQGNRGARSIAILAGFVTIGLGVAMIFLLAVPRSSRAWFTPGFQDSAGGEFAALLVRTEDRWVVSEPELADVETMDELADLAREAAPGDETVLVLIEQLEQENGWYGIVRVDGDAAPRVFVSHAAVVNRSSWGEVLLADCEPEDQEDDLPAGPVGEFQLLDDFGISEAKLLSFSDDFGEQLADALGARL